MRFHGRLHYVIQVVLGTPILLWALVAAPGPGLPVLDITGTESLRNGKPAEALAELEAVTGVEDSAYHLFKLGLAYHHAGDHSNALRSLRQVAQSCSVLAPCAYEFIARTELAQQRLTNALAAYRSSLSYPKPQRYQAELQKTIAQVIAEGDMDAGEMLWLGPWYRLPQVADTTTGGTIDTLVHRGDWKAIDSLASLYLKNGAQEEACEVFSRIPFDSVPDTAFGTGLLFGAAAALEDCGKYEAADAWLSRASQRPDFRSEVSATRSTYLHGMLSYKLKRYDKAIDWLLRFERNYGPSPGGIITLARSYRYSGRPKKAAEWYDRHIEVFPRHSQTQAILWYRAWQREENGQLRTAIRLYRRLHRQYRYGSRVVDALFRMGLLHYRLEEHDSAQHVWRRLIDKYPRSSEVTAAAFWRAKSLLATGDTREAKRALRSVIERNPLRYYSYRAQEILRELGDKTNYVEINPTTDVEESRGWLDSIVAADGQSGLEPQDSLAYRVGTMLVAVGLAEQADYYLEPLLLRYSDRLALQFEVAMLYAICGYPTHSYRAARSMAWRIPRRYRSGIPLVILSMIYPRAFISTIKPLSQRYTVESNLISAIIRQESIFDPKIVSPVGAIGLMQLMPYTAKDIAQGLGVEYMLDSLYYPSTNIHYGTYYVRQLLDKFDDNIVLVLAGYNGGPHNAKRWYERNEDQEFDMFIENISYSETREYVKRVLANYWTYSRLSDIDAYTGELTWDGGS